MRPGVRPDLVPVDLRSFNGCPFMKPFIRFLLLGWFLLVSQGAFGWTLSGTVFGNGTPMPNAGVKLFLASDGSTVGQTATNGSGYYSLTVDDGTYNLLVEPPSGAAGYGNSPVSGIVIAGTNITQNEALVTGASTLSGVVKLPDGTPVGGLDVSLQNQANGIVVGSMRTGSDGVYSFAVVPGNYKYYLNGYEWTAMQFPGSPYHLGIYNFSPISVVTGSTTKDLILPLARLSGKTTDSNGVAVGDVGFNIDTSGSKIDGSSYQVQTHSAYTKSDASGNYSMTLFDGFKYAITIVPSTGSGFAQTTLSGLNVSGPTLLGVILQRPDTIAPRILSGPLITQVGANSATVAWQTDEPATGSANWGSGSASETGYQTQHAVLMTGLTAVTPYTVTVSSTDWAGNGPTTASVAFTTGLSDTTAPLIIAGPTVNTLTHQSAVVEWETNEPATTQVSGDLSATIAGLRTLHRVELTGLSALTTYQISVASSDQAGNGPTTRAISFKTLAAADLTAPVITKGPWFVDVTETGATVAWETDEPANSGVSYNDGVAYGVLNDDALAQNHSVSMVGLTANALYQVTVSSTDAFGNGPTLSQPLAVRTLGTADTEPPVFIEPPTVCNVTDRLIQVCLRTDEPASLVIEYGLAPDVLTWTAARARLDPQHSLSISGLTAKTTFLCAPRYGIRRVMSRSARCSRRPRSPAPGPSRCLCRHRL